MLVLGEKNLYTNRLALKQNTAIAFIKKSVNAK